MIFTGFDNSNHTANKRMAPMKTLVLHYQNLNQLEILQWQTPLNFYGHSILTAYEESTKFTPTGVSYCDFGIHH